MVAPITIVIGGRRFESLSTAASHYRIALSQLVRRLRSGWSPEEAVGLVAHKRAVRASAAVSCQGTQYDSVAALSKARGVKEATVAARLRAGRSMEEALSPVPVARPPKKGKRIEFAGQTFCSWKKLAEAHSISYLVFRKRYLNGWTLAQALGHESPPPRFRDYTGHAREQMWKQPQTVEGKSVPSTSVGSYKLYVISNKVNGKQYIGITISPLAVRMSNHVACAKKGVKNKLYNAMRYHGVAAFEIAIVRSDATDFAELQRQEIEEIEKRQSVANGYNVSLGGSLGTAKSITVEGREFAAWGEAATFYGVDPRVFALRISRLKWTPEEAAGLVKRTRYARMQIDVGGVSFPSLRAAAGHFGVDYKLAHDRMKSKGWTLEEALGLTPRTRRRAK